jgi:bacteriorhodopsin
MNPLHVSAYSSLALQIVAGLIEVWALSFTVRDEDAILKEILWSEVVVQAVEFIFYCYLVYKIVFNHVPLAITAQRYIDWSITTPIMLVNFAMFFLYLDNKKHQGRSYFEIIREEAPTLLKIVAANALMLAFGYMGETGIMNINVSTALGFIPFAYIFKQLYSNYVGEDSTSQAVFYGIFLVWALYGVSAVLPFQTKNTTYNILDLFSKNVFGVFLAFYITGLSRGQLKQDT